jgi:hypothetical protein
MVPTQEKQIFPLNLPQDRDRIRCRKYCVLKNNRTVIFRWIMSRNLIFVPMCHRHKLLVLVLVFNIRS